MTEIAKANPVSPRRFVLWLAVFTIGNVAVIDWMAPRIGPAEFFLRPSAAWSRWASDIDSPALQRDSWSGMFRAYSHLEAGGEGLLYQEIFFEQGVKFQYPPTALLVMTAARVDPEDSPETAYRQLNMVSWLAVPLGLAAVVLLFAWSWRRHLGRTGRSEWYALGLVTLLAVSFFPIIDSYRLGQIQTWLNASIAVAFLAWVLGREAVAGVLVGLMCLVKPHYGVVYLWALLRRRWSFVAGATAAGATGLSVSLALFGWRNHLDYLPVVSTLSRRGEAYFPNQSFNGLLNRLAYQDPTMIMRFTDQFPPFNAAVYASSTLATLCLVGACLLLRRRTEADEGVLALSIPTITATIASPIAWEHHYGAILPVFALLLPWSLVVTRGRRTAIAVLGVGYLLTAHPFLMRGAPGGYAVFDRIAGTPLNILFSYMLLGGLLLLGLTYAVLLARVRTGDR